MACLRLVLCALSVSVKGTAVDHVSVGWRLLQSDWRAGPAWVTATRDPRDRVAAMGRRGEGGVDGDLGSPFTPTGRNCDREGKPGGNLERFV